MDDSSCWPGGSGAILFFLVFLFGLAAEPSGFVSLSACCAFFAFLFSFLSALAAASSTSPLRSAFGLFAPFFFLLDLGVNDVDSAESEDVVVDFRRGHEKRHHLNEAERTERQKNTAAERNQGINSASPGQSEDPKPWNAGTRRGRASLEAAASECWT